MSKQRKILGTQFDQNFSHVIIACLYVCNSSPEKKNCHNRKEQTFIELIPWEVNLRQEHIVTLYEDSGRSLLWKSPRKGKSQERNNLPSCKQKAQWRFYPYLQKEGKSHHIKCCFFIMHKDVTHKDSIIAAPSKKKKN